jgi:hypothetical protein
MSGMALIWAANVKGLKPAAKIVLIQLADFHNKETGQCNPSAKRLADECEMGRATLFRHMTTLEQCGLVTRHARGDGGSNQYELHLDITLGPSSRRKGGASGPNGVVYQNETGGNVSKKRGKGPSGETGVVPNRDRNLTIEPVKEPPTRKREAAVGEVEKILAAYPPDRLRCRAACLTEARRRKPIPRVDPALVLAVGRIGGNLNQIARWLNRAMLVGRTDLDVLTVARRLLTIERQLAQIVEASPRC